VKEASDGEKKAALGVSMGVMAVGGCILLFICGGVGAAIAIPAFVTYVKRSKTEEARTSLLAMESGAQSYCLRNRGYPPSAGPKPAVPGDQKQMVTDWNDPGFVDLGFAPADPLYYSYSTVHEGGSLRLRAEGDLDGDGVRSTFEVTCDPECSCGDIYEENELE